MLTKSRARSKQETMTNKIWRIGGLTEALRVFVNECAVSGGAHIGNKSNSGACRFHLYSFRVCLRVSQISERREARNREA